jgi:hypothetical protein
MMDFFKGLNNWYRMIKTDYINGLTSKAINPLKDLNEIYLLANQWLKPKAGSSGATRRQAASSDEKHQTRETQETSQMLHFLQPTI